MGRSTALLFLLAMALHSYDALAESAGEHTPHSTSLRGAVEEQAPTLEEQAPPVEEELPVVWVHVPADLFEVLASTYDQEEQALTAEEHDTAARRLDTAARRLMLHHALFISMPFWIYGLYTTGTPGMGLKPAPNMFKLWEEGGIIKSATNHADKVHHGYADWF